MIKKFLVGVGLAYTLSGCMQATEFRAPLVSEHGPLRYDMVQKKKKVVT